MQANFVSVAVLVLSAAALFGVAEGPVAQDGLQSEEENVAAEFRRRLELWEEDMGRRLRVSAKSFRSEAEWEEIDRICIHENSYFWDLVSLGPEAVPFCLDVGRFDTVLVRELTGFWPRDYRTDLPDGTSPWTWEEFPDTRRVRHISVTVIVHRWWKERTQRTPVWFAERLAAYEEFKRKGNAEKAAYYLQRIQEIGIEGLPLMIEAIDKGKTDLIPGVVNLSRRHWAPKEMHLPDNPTAEECVAWWKKYGKEYRLPPSDSEAGKDEEAKSSADASDSAGQ